MLAFGVYNLKVRNQDVHCNIALRAAGVTTANETYRNHEQLQKLTLCCAETLLGFEIVSRSRLGTKLALDVHIIPKLAHLTTTTAQIHVGSLDFWRSKPPPRFRHLRAGQHYSCQERHRRPRQHGYFMELIAVFPGFLRFAAGG